MRKLSETQTTQIVKQITKAKPIQTKLGVVVSGGKVAVTNYTLVNLSL